MRRHVATPSRLAGGWKDAIEALPAGIELYDADDRLTMVNRTNLAMYPQLADLPPSSGRHSSRWSEPTQRAAAYPLLIHPKSWTLGS